MMRIMATMAMLSVLWGCASGLQQSAMWGLHSPKDMDGWGTLTFDLGNSSEIASNYRSHGIRALWPLGNWTIGQKEQCYAPVKHQQTNASGYFNCITLNPYYREAWALQWKELQPLASAGSAIGVFLGDEHLYFGLKVSEVKLVADMIRLDWPTAIIYMNEAPDVAMCNYRKDNTSIFGPNECLPQNIDWFGFDFYASDSSSWESPQQAYREQVYPRFSRTDQRVVPVTGGFAAGNFSATERAEIDDFCTTNARHFLEFGLRDPRVVGIFPFYWPAGKVTPSGGVNTSIGISVLPRCAATYKALGMIISAAGPAGTSQDPSLRPPVPIDGKFVEPKCATPIPNPPSTWEWCSRTNPTTALSMPGRWRRPENHK